MLLLAEDWGQEQQGDGSDCRVSLVPPKEEQHCVPWI